MIAAQPVSLYTDAVQKPGAKVHDKLHTALQKRVQSKSRQMVPFTESVCPIVFHADAEKWHITAAMANDFSPIGPTPVRASAPCTMGCPQLPFLNDMQLSVSTPRYNQEVYTATDNGVAQAATTAPIKIVQAGGRGLLPKYLFACARNALRSDAEGGVVAVGSAIRTSFHPMESRNHPK